MSTLQPDYYKTGGIDVIEFCQRQGLPFTLGNVVKYVTRAGRKNADTAIEDLQKAREYIDREIAFREKNGEKDDCTDIKAVPVEDLAATETEKPLSRLEELWRRNTEENLKFMGSAMDALEAASHDCPSDYGLSGSDGGSWLDCKGNCAKCWTRPYKE